MKTPLIAALVLLTISMEAPGGFIDGNKLHGYANSDDPIHLSIFFGYVIGVVDAHWDMLCIPIDASSAQVKDVAKVYLENHPEERHFTAESIVVKAISEAFPCKE